MLFERQRVLLTLLDALGGNITATDFQKLLFLYSQQESKPSYEFVPYRFGCFSFTSYADKRRLIERGLLVDDEHHWQLTSAGHDTARNSAVSPLSAAAFNRTHRSLRGNSLIAEVYRRFPYYATRSEIVKKVLTSKDEQERVDQARPAPASPGILTIGYEGKTLEAYLNQLLRARVTVLCDVRRNPLSRKYGFSKGTLSRSCEGVGIRYEHLPQLGIPSDERRDLRTQADYDALFANYERKILPLQGQALSTITRMVQAGDSVALTCFELHHQQCHRHCVAEAIDRDSSGKLKASHL